ncbi:hypothetical protein BDR04DRAFT_157485 [Suillus decipiens]|nr:hypothetical protein BDR04DRAFT_157485 [Suillus decipiens]
MSVRYQTTFPVALLLHHLVALLLPNSPQAFSQGRQIPLPQMMERRKRKNAVRKPNGGNKKKLAKRHIESLAMLTTNVVPAEIGPFRAHLNPAKTLIRAGVVTCGAVVRLYQLAVRLMLLDM